MSKQDFMGVRNFSDVQKELLGLKKNLIYSSNTLLKVNNEMNNILTSLIINLKDILGSQSEVSLWFYIGTPTTSTVPYKNWTTPADHYGDIYYDQSTGKVYQYDISGWTENQDNSLIQAMALTNSQLTSNDHERKVFFDTPITPYDSGDWWIQDNGILYICQLGKVSTLTYEETDWIPSNQYTTTVAIKDGNRTTVLEGTVTQITKDYVKFTDLSTGGSTTIAGENITTGVIKSSNYVANSTGTLINLNTGVIDTKNFKVDSDGNVNLYSLVTQKGVFNSIIETKSDSVFGPLWNMENEITISPKLFMDINIPDKFIINSAKIILCATPVYWDNMSLYGITPKIFVYKHTNTPIYADYMGEGITENDRGEKITTEWNPSSTEHQTQYKAFDISNKLNAGELNRIIVSSEIIFNSQPSDLQLAANTGSLSATLQISGYLSI